MVKRCFKCGDTKPLDEFYKHKMMRDGRLNKCKACAILDASNHRAANLDKIREYDRVRAKRPDRKNHMRSVVKRRYEEAPNATRARLRVARAVKAGKLQREPCEVCGAKNVHAHHDDYAKPLEVRWLCVAHHSQWHQKHGPGRNAA